ncbi:MAG TPA: PQQ-binding-like beta-propeller repeat protein [Verrucomicrobiales bacterium]|jgi:outer membrane protein assembly factor BamB|nr:PQQ-binding-like beta-propeller repeat protein [Verrucomicrobiales bacterium]
MLSFPFPRLCAATVLLTIVSGAQAENWPQFRGPSGQGISAEKDLPVKWDVKTGENIAWKVALPKGDSQYSSPIVWGDRVFVTGVRNAPLAHWVQCYAVTDGKFLWETPVAPGPLLLTDLRGGYGAPTPCTDGKRVYVAFGSAVVAALDFEGKQIWRKEIANHAFDVALGSSPVLYRDTVIMNCDQTGKTSSIIGYDAATGDIRWEAKRPETGFSHSTPVIVEIGGKPQMLVNATSAIQGLDPDNGKVLWWCASQGDAASPAFGGGLVFSDSGRGGKGICVDPGGSGDVTKTHLKWTVAQISEGLSSPIITGERVWRTHGPEILKSFHLKTGERVLSERLAGISTWASPFATADGRLYFASAGKTYVVRAAEPLEVLAVNDTGEENRASAAVSNGRIFLRGDKSLFCIRKP